MAPFSLGAGHRICDSTADYQLQGAFPFGEGVSGIWASLFAGKRHRRPVARSSPMATLVMADDKDVPIGLGCWEAAAPAR